MAEINGRLPWSVDPATLKTQKDIDRFIEYRRSPPHHPLVAPDAAVIHIGLLHQQAPKVFLSAGKWWALWHYWADVAQLNCGGTQVKEHRIGVMRGVGTIEVVYGDYDRTVRDVDEFASSFDMWMDVRDLYMMQRGCCPIQIIAGFQE